MPIHTLINPWTWVINPPIQLPLSTNGSIALVREFSVRPSQCPLHQSTWNKAVSGRDILLCAGLATSPATSPNDLSAWGFLVEHANSLTPNAGRLRIVDDAADWDFRTKGLFSERMGMGLASLLLWKDFDVVHIADAAPFISRAVLNLPASNPYHNAQLKLNGTYGEYKPDFFCLTPNLEAVIAESKGAMGPPSAIPVSERKKAKEQVNNVNPVGVNLRAQESRLAFATNLRLRSDNAKAPADSGVYVEDPDGNEETLPVPVSADEITIHSYSKYLQFLGLGVLGLFLREDFRPILRGDLDEFTSDIDGEPILFLAAAPRMRFGLLRSVADTLFLEQTQGVAKRVSALLMDSRFLRKALVEPRTTQFVLPNGIVGVENL